MLRSTRKKRREKYQILASRQNVTELTVSLATAPVNIVVSDTGEVSADGSQSPARFDAIAYSGGIMSRYISKPPLPFDCVIDLKGMKVERNVVANLDHEQIHRVGHVPEIEVEASHVRAAGILSAATQYRDEVVNSARDGFHWEVSIEALLSKPELLGRGRSVVVNGQTFTGPLYIMRESTLYGLAFVSRGADDGNSVRIAAIAPQGVRDDMNEFEKWAVNCGIDLDTMTEEGRAELLKTYNAKAAADANLDRNRPLGSVALQSAAEQMRQKLEREDKINAIATKTMAENPRFTDQIEAMAQASIQQDMAPDQFELELLRGLRVDTRQLRVASARRAPSAKVVECALSMAAGLPDIEKHYSEQILDAVDKHEMRHFSLQQLLIEVACSNGYEQRRSGRITAANIREVLEFAFPPRVTQVKASMPSSYSLSGILSNVASKELLAGFTEEDQSWREISQTKPVSDFKAVTSYRMTDSLEYEEIGKGGEIKHGTLGEESYTRQAKTYAKMLGLSRQDIINDDLGAFDDLRTRLGRGAARKFNNVFWAKFLANTGLFPTDGSLNNYLAGATTTLLVDGVGLEQGVAHFHKMKSADGKRVGGRPSIVLVPPELQFVAQKHYVGANVNTGGAATAVSVPNANIHAGLYRPVVVDWLSDAAFTGNSATAWYLFRDPRVLAAMVVSFLNGQQTPTVESSDADFNNLGIQFRGYHDFGCDHAEPLSGVKVKGAA